MKKRIVSFLLATLMMLSLGTTALAGEIIEVGVAQMEKSSTDTRVEAVIADKITSINADIAVYVTKTLSDFAGNEYKLVECVPIGYFIIHLESGIIVEHAVRSPSPYMNLSTNLFYGGPTYYYVEVNGDYSHTLMGDTLSSTDVARAAELCDVYDSELVMQADVDIARYIEGSVDTIRSSAVATTAANTDYWVTSYTWLKNRTSGFGYVSGGYCGYIAANLVLKYWHYRGKITLSSSYSTTNSTALTNKLISLGSGGGTVAWDIKAVINDFASESGYAQNAHWAVGVSNITNEIKNNKRPVILFGNLADAKNHAVVVYGYNEYENSGYYTFVCHYGWNNWPEVHVYGGTSIFGSNTQYRL